MKKTDAAALPAKHTAHTQVDQHARFVETARALGCDEDEAAFDEKLKGIVGPVPKGSNPGAIDGVEEVR